jgi:hypothetical protein
MSGVMQSMEGVVQSARHPHDHDNADAHGNANRCEHVGHLRVLVGGGERRHDDSTAIIIPPA